MKKHSTFKLLLVFLLFSSLLLPQNSLAQAFIINSPQEIAGGYEFMATTNFGATVTDSVWTADAVFVDDGSAVPTEGCAALINGEAVAGKIALIDRGTCEFGLKCLNAENAGAIAAIVINTAPGAGTINMGAGAVGGQVNIPCAMIPYEVGQLIRNAMMNGSTINISIGDLVPPPPPANDISVTNNNILIPLYGTIPASQVQQAGDFVFTPGAEVINKGTNTAPNYGIDLTITHTPFGGSPTEVYNETFSSTDTLASGDTTDIVLFPEFDPVEIGGGIYNYVYTISMDSVDNASFNNVARGSFTLSDNIYSKATWNPVTGAPNVTATTSLAGGGAVEFITALDIPYGLGFKIDTVSFDVRRSGGLAGVPLQVFVYEWDDANDDSSIDSLEITEIRGVAVFTFPQDAPEDRIVLRLPILDFETFEETGVVIPANDMKYLVGARYEGTETVTFGFDANIDYDRTVAWKDTLATDLDQGFLGAQEWGPDGIPTPGGLFVFTNNTVTSTGVSFNLLTDVEDLVGPEQFEILLFPNPVSDELQVNLTLKENLEYVEYYAFDAIGRLVIHQRTTNPIDFEQAKFNTSQLAAGEYHLVIRTDLGIQTKSFVVKH